MRRDILRDQRIVDKREQHRKTFLFFNLNNSFEKNIDMFFFVVIYYIYKKLNPSYPLLDF